ncbi:hypothetical protein ACHRV1_16005 [Flavobacterium aquidurense]|uniref:hypothetical protein n=1 Tax=Flavobacterium aquidurense TaxID=362413 RepID=UPI003756AF31
MLLVSLLTSSEYRAARRLLFNNRTSCRLQERGNPADTLMFFRHSGIFKDFKNSKYPTITSFLDNLMF